MSDPAPPPPSSTSTPPTSTSSTSASTSSPSSTSSPTPVFPSRPLALFLCIACPALLLMPPRKLDLYTFSLGTAWAFSAGHLYMPSARPQPVGISAHQGLLPAQETASSSHEQIPSGKEETPSAKGEFPPAHEEEPEGVRGMWRRLWRRETPEGQRRRAREEREKLESGIGYGGIIGEQIVEALGRRREVGEENGDEEGERKG